MSKRSIFLKLFLFGFLFTPLSSMAHVGYVIPAEEILEYSGTDYSFLYSVFTEPQNLALMLGTVILFFIFYFFITKNSLFKKFITSVEERTLSYEQFIPWMIRLGLGIALIGSGTAGVLVSPILSDFTAFSFIQIFLGFLFLSGFLLVPAIISAIALFFVALSNTFYLVGNLDFLALALALLIYANSKPGVDDLIGIPNFNFFSRFKEYIPLILRIGIGVAMAFLGVYEKILNPHISELVIQNYQLSSVVPVSAGMWVLSAGLIEVLIGLLLMFGFKTRLASVIAFVVLSMSFFFFKEDVYSHVTLFTILSIIFVLGGGKYSLDNFFNKKV